MQARFVLRLQRRFDPFGVGSVALSGLQVGGEFIQLESIALAQGFVGVSPFGQGLPQAGQQGMA